jgi:hypothetical protein
MSNVIPQFGGHKESERLLDLSGKGDGDKKTSAFGSTISLGQKSNNYKKVNKDVEDLQNFIAQEEPPKEFTQRIQGAAPGVSMSTTQKSNERIKWETQKDKINEEHKNKVIPFAEKSGLSNNESWNALPKEEQYLTYLSTARNMSSMEEDISKINFGARPDLDKTVKQHQLSGIRNFNIDGAEVGLDKLKDELGKKGTDLSELTKDMTIIGRDQMGRMVVQYNKDTRKGVEEKIIRFHPSNEAKIAFDPIQKVVNNFNIKDAKPMRIDNEDGSVWLVDYEFSNDELVPRIIEGEKSDFVDIAVNKEGEVVDPDKVKNFINKNKQYVTDLKTMSDYRYNQYNAFYEDFIGK